MPPLHIIKIVDLLGIVSGTVSFILLARFLSRGPGAYRKPLLFFIAGLLSFIFSLVISFFAHPFAGTAAEAFHHFFLLAGIALFVIGANRFRKMSP